MRFSRYMTEDMDKIRAYKKAVFDLKVTMKELEFQKGEKLPADDAEKRIAVLNKTTTLKLKLIQLKAKILKLGLNLNDGFEFDEDELKKILAEIPDVGSEEELELKKERERLTK